MKRKVAFVDDEQGVLDTLRHLLHKKADVWELYFYRTAEEALEMTASIEFDTIVADVRMPGGMSGFALLEALRSRESTKLIPVIVLTGVDEPNLKRRALDLGATDLLEKPCETEDLIARVRSALQAKAYQDEIKRHNLTLERKVRERTRELEISRINFLRRLAKAGEYRDEVTGWHVMRVGWYCRLIAEALGLDRDFVQMIHLTSPLHDIGKIGISDRILLKPGELTADERDIMQAHCVIGANILREHPAEIAVLPLEDNDLTTCTLSLEEGPILDMASKIALYHHERWNGSGYPNGLAGEDIPLEARIVCLVDVYDALGSHRPYKNAYSEEEVRSIIQSEAGRFFAPDIYEAFISVLPKIEKIKEQFPAKMALSAMGR